MDSIFSKLQAARDRIKEAKISITSSINSTVGSNEATGLGAYTEKPINIEDGAGSGVYVESPIHKPLSLPLDQSGLPIHSLENGLNPEVQIDLQGGMTITSTETTTALSESPNPVNNNSTEDSGDNIANISTSFPELSEPQSNLNVENTEILPTSPQIDNAIMNGGELVEPNDGESIQPNAQEPIDPNAVDFGNPQQDGLNDYDDQQGGQPGSLPDSVLGGPNSTTTGQLNTGGGANIELDDQIMDAVANPDSSHTGTSIHTESTGTSPSIDLGVVSASIPTTSTQTQQVTHNSDNTSSVTAQTDNTREEELGASVVVTGGNISQGPINTSIVENSGPTDVVQNSIASNGGLIDSSDVTAVQEGMTVVEIGDQGFDDSPDPGTVSSISHNSGISAEVGIGNVNARITLDQTTANVTSSSQSDIDTTTITNTGNTTIVGTGETSIESTEFSISNESGTEVGGSGTTTSGGTTITNTTQTTVTDNVAHENSHNGLTDAQAQADSGIVTLGDDGNYDHVEQITTTHTETVSQGTIQTSVLGVEHSEGDPAVINNEVNQQTTTTHMQGEPGGTPDHKDGLFDFSDNDDPLGVSSNHSIHESSDDGEPGFSIEQNSNGSIPLSQPLETVTASTGGPDGVTIEGTPEEIQANAQQALQSNPNNPVLQDVADGVPLPEAVQNDANSFPELMTIGHDNTSSVEAIEAIGQEQEINSQNTASDNQLIELANSTSGTTETGTTETGTTETGTTETGTTGTSTTNTNNGSSDHEQLEQQETQQPQQQEIDAQNTASDNQLISQAQDHEANNDSDESASSSSSGCFLTTSACEHRGLADDCHELTVLRGFRDTWMHATPELQEQVREYYRVAPAVVDAIQTMPDRTATLERMFTEYIRPSVEAIERGENAEAYDIYVKMLRNVQELTTTYMTPSAI